MFGSVILDVAVGMVLVFLLVSLIATAAQETIARWTNQRSQMLEGGIKELFDEPELVGAIYEHPMIASLYTGRYADARKNNRLPSYIPSSSFSAAFLDIAVRGRDVDSSTDAGPNAARLTPETLRRMVGRLENRRAQRFLLTALDLSGDDMTRVRAAVEAWFNAAMERVSGKYKRQTQRHLLRLGFVMAVVANVDALRVMHRLYSDPTIRQAAVAMAESVAKDSASLRSPQADRALGQIQSLALPIGWQLNTFPAGAFASKTATALTLLQLLVGWTLTALAISLGAPFWFELLNKFMVIRSTVKPNEKSGPEKPKDPQAPVAAPAAGTPGQPVTIPPGAVLPTRPYEANEWASGHPQGGIL
jgi:hypothetical protein